MSQPLPISLLACGGALPREIAEILAREQRPLNIVTIRGMADADYSGFDVTTVGFGQIGALLRGLKTGGARDLVIAGHVQRPDLRKLKIDLGFIRNIFSILALQRGGDDHVMRRIASFFESHGFTVRSIAEVAPELLAPSGLLTGTFDSQIEKSAYRGVRTIQALGRFDIGQAVIVSKGRTIAIEAAEGTNGLIARCAGIKRQENTNPAAKPVNAGSDELMLVKVPKPEQDLRLDLPTVGVQTIRACATAGINWIALEANRTLIINRCETLKEAISSGIGIVGLDQTNAPNLESSSAKRLAETSIFQILKNKQLSAKHHPDLTKGKDLLDTLAKENPAKAVVIARENILAVNISEPNSVFLKRIGHLAQWGDRRERHRRNRVLVMETTDDLDPQEMEAIAGDSRYVGIGFLRYGDDTTRLETLLDHAGQDVFVGIWQ